MKKHSKKEKETTGTAASVKGFAANSAEFIPSETEDNKAFTDSLNNFYDIIPDIKPNRFE